MSLIRLPLTILVLGLALQGAGQTITNNGKRVQLKEGRKIVFAFDKAGELTKAQLKEMKDEMLTVVVTRGKRTMELQTNELAIIGKRNLPSSLGGTFIIMGRVLLGKWSLNKEYLLFRKYDLNSGWALRK